ncbi:hypothetical protein L0F63_004826, partial [Massospora cicadina]
WALLSMTFGTIFNVSDTYSSAPVVYPTESLVRRLVTHSLFSNQTVESAANVELLRLNGMKGLNGFAEAIHLAYDNHHGLVLSPDHIFITLLQGLSIHINLDPDRHRTTLGRDGKPNEKLIVGANDFVLGKFENDWQRLFPRFHELINQRIDPQIASLLNLTFTTSTPLSKAVASLTVMNAVKAFFEFVVVTRCGIPEIFLKGTKEDWIQLKSNALKLISRFDGLEFWLPELIPVLDEFINAASNQINVTFWSSIYKLDKRSGGPFITGWINALYPYLQDEFGFFRNQYIQDGPTRRSYYGPAFNLLPPGFTQSSFIWDYLSQPFNMNFVAGFLGVKHHHHNFISPALAWAVVHSN